MTIQELSLVHVCDECRGAFILSEGRCRGCGSSGAHYSVSDSPPDWMWLVPDTVPLVVGGRVQHYLDRTAGYVKALCPDGYIEVLWVGQRSAPTIVRTPRRWLRIDLEDPSGAAYGYALRWAWNEMEALPGEVSVAGLGQLLTDFVAGRTPTDDDRKRLAGYCERIAHWSQK